MGIAKKNNVSPRNANSYFPSPFFSNVRSPKRRVKIRDIKNAVPIPSENQ